MRKTIVALVVLVPVLVLAASYAAVRQTRAHHVAQAAETAEGSSPPEPREMVVRHVLSIENAPPPPPQAPAAPQIEASESRPTVEKTPAEYGAALEAAFRADGPADGKANALSESVSSAFHEPAAKGMTLDRVECHATRCRMEVRFDDEASDKRVLPEFFSLLSAKGVDITGMRFVVPVRDTEPDGKIRATIHVFRGDG
jgi:hypothetical protein